MKKKQPHNTLAAVRIASCGMSAIGPAGEKDAECCVGLILLPRDVIARQQD